MSKLIYRAAQFAKRCHTGQKRKYTKRPYITHPAGCVGRILLLSDTTDEDVAIMWLHDVIEDCGVWHAELEAEFGKVVADGVLELTNPSNKHPELKRHERKLMDLEHARGMSIKSKQKKMIDRIGNLYDIGDHDPSFAELYLYESARLLTVLKDAHEELASEFRDAMEYLNENL